MFTGHGSIAAYPVKCIPPEWMVKLYSGDELDVVDFHDVRLLCSWFGFPFPEKHE
jgi:hypothetical protein